MFSRHCCQQAASFIDLETMVKQIFTAGISAQHLFLDSWFMMPVPINASAEYIDVIGMIKKSQKNFYHYNGHSMGLKAIYGKLKKRRRRANLLTNTLVQLKTGICSG